MIADLEQSAKLWLADVIENFSHLIQSGEPPTLELNIHGASIEMKLLGVSGAKDKAQTVESSSKTLALQWVYSRNQLRHTGWVNCKRGFIEYFIAAAGDASLVRSERNKAGFDLYIATEGNVSLCHLKHGATVKSLKEYAQKHLNAKVIETSDDARAVINEAGINRNTVTKSQLTKLHKCINNRMRTSGCYGGSYRMNEDIGLFMTCRTSQWEEREAISFNRDDFVGIAGWADAKNKKPILEAVRDWLVLLS